MSTLSTLDSLHDHTIRLGADGTSDRADLCPESASPLSPIRSTRSRPSAYRTKISRFSVRSLKVARADLMD